MNNDDMTRALEDLIDQAIENAKKEGKIGSYSRITYDELGRPLVDGINIAINDQKNKTIKNFENLVKALAYKRDFMLISEGDYYKELEALRDKHLIKGSSQWWKYTAQIIEYEQSITLTELQEAALREEIMEKAAAAQEKYLEKISQAKTKYANKLKAYGDDFFAVRNTVTNFDTGATEAKAKLANYEAYTNRLKRFQSQLEKLRARGIVPEDLLREVTKMDIDQGMEYIELLNRTSDAALKDYISDRNEYIKLCEEMAQNAFSYEASPEALAAFTTTMEEIFEKAGLVLPENFYELGQTGADNFGQGFMGGLKVIEEDLSSGFTDGFKSSLEAAAQVISQIYSAITYSTGESLGSKVINNITNSFTVGTEKESSAQQISSWRNAQTLERLRS